MVDHHPQGATVGQGRAAALIHSSAFGDTTTQTFLTVDK